MFLEVDFSNSYLKKNYIQFKYVYMCTFFTLVLQKSKYMHTQDELPTEQDGSWTELMCLLSSS